MNIQGADGCHVRQTVSPYTFGHAWRLSVSILETRFLSFNDVSSSGIKIMGFVKTNLILLMYVKIFHKYTQIEMTCRILI